MSLVPKSSPPPYQVLFVQPLPNAPGMRLDVCSHCEQLSPLSESGPQVWIHCLLFTLYMTNACWSKRRWKYNRTKWLCYHEQTNITLKVKCAVASEKFWSYGSTTLGGRINHHSACIKPLPMVCAAGTIQKGWPVYPLRNFLSKEKWDMARW